MSHNIAMKIHQNPKNADLSISITLNKVIGIVNVQLEKEIIIQYFYGTDISPKNTAIFYI